MSTSKMNKRRMRPAALALLATVCALLAPSLGGCKPRSTSDSAPEVENAAADQPWSVQVARVRSAASREIKLEQTAVSSQELVELEGLTGLQTLILDAGVVRDEDVATIAGLAGLPRQ